MIDLKEQGTRSEQQNAKIEQIRREAERKAREFSDVFSSDAGKRVLNEIKLQFEPDVLATGDSDSTIIRAAQRDVVRWIEQMTQRGQGYELEG